MSSIRPWRDIERRKTRRVMVGDVPVGGDSPITVQSMTNTPTPDVQATINQILIKFKLKIRGPKTNINGCCLLQMVLILFFFLS
mgnify:CR=1 FL=1